MRLVSWTWENVLVIVIGLVAIGGGILLIRNREAAFKFIVEQNANLYGEKLGARLRRASPTWGVVVPAAGFIVIGTWFILFGVFGHPR